MDKLVGAFSGVLKTSGAQGGQPQAHQSDKQYLRLPLESARKLRWFEKADLQALTKTHFREKRELLDTISALKKVLVRHGLVEAKLDAEVATHLRSAEEIAQEHEGVASVLLAALEPHVLELRFENERLQAALRGRQAAGASSSGQAQSNDSRGPEANGAASGGNVGSAAEALHLRALTAGGVLPRRLEHLDLAEPSVKSDGACMDPVAEQQVVALESQCEQLTKQVTELKAALAKQQQAVAAAARRRGGDGNDASRAQLQDMLLTLQEAAREETRKAARAEARATRLEGELKTLQAQHRTLSKDHGALQQQVGELREQLEAAGTEAAARAAAAAAAGEGARSAAEAREEAAALRQVAGDLRTELANTQACVSRLEADLQLTRQRETAAVAARTEAEALNRRCDELAATNLQLTQRLAESRAELEMAAYYKKVCGELTESKARQDSELLSLGSLLSASEFKIAELVTRLALADEQLAMAETRARAAESAVSSEVERRCGAVLSSRALWPQTLRGEVTGLEARVAQLEEAYGTAARQAERAALGEREAREELRVKSEELTVLSSESAAAATSFAAQLQQLREALAEAQARTAGLQHDLATERAHRQAAREEAERAAASAGPRRAHSSAMLSMGGGSGSSTSNGGAPPLSTAVMTPKWQVQNKVGSGSLYNLGSGGSSNGVSDDGGGGGRGGAGGVDSVYLKNVLFKFLEAHMCNKVAERDVLLPAVATLLQATQEEYAALQKILRATAPPSRQVLSVFGLSR